MKRTLNDTLRPKLRLTEVERLIKVRRILVPPPSRRKLVKMCEEGVFETVGDRATSFGWLVYEDSFDKWAREMDGV